MTRRGFYFRLYPGSIKTPQLLHFLGHLKRQVRRKILLVWDRLGVHRSKAVRVWFKAQGDRFVVEELPAYAPELNPVEYLWGWWKPNTVANGCARTEEELHWLARHPGVTSVGLAWSCCETQFAIEAHDMPLTLIVTDREVIAP